MARSKKPEVFEHLFYQRYDEQGMQSPRWDCDATTIPEDRRIVYSDEVVRAIQNLGVSLGHNQAANFAKDFLRKKSRSSNWPKALAELRWTMKQRTGKEPTTNRARNFIFKPYDADQRDPFPDDWPTPNNSAEHSIQSVTISLASKLIERLDETRLMQIVVDLRIVETHFALFSPLSTENFKIVHMDHLQMGLKLRNSEIDGLYLAEFIDANHDLHSVLITVEAKKHDEFINTTQVISQVLAVSGLGIDCDKIVAIALKHVEGGVMLFEFKPFVPPPGVRFAEGSLSDEDLVEAATVRYRVLPAMRGLSKSAARPRSLRWATPASPDFIEPVVDPTLLSEEPDDDDDG